MTAKALSVIWWIVGTFGVGGLVAFWFLAPTAAQLTLQAVVKFFQLVLSYRIGCALIAAVLAGVIVDYKRHAYDDAQFAARTAAFERAQTARDGRIAQETRDKVWKEIADATAQNVSIDNEVKEFSDAPPPAATGNPLLISDADADRLCKLAGQTQCGPSGDKGVPKARRSGGSAANSWLKLPNIIRTGARPNQ